MNAEELKASKLILDLGVSIPVRPLRFLNSRRKPGNVVVRHPYAGGLIRMCRQRMEIGVTHEEMKGYTIDQNIEFVAKHGKAVSLIVAGSIVHRWLSYKLFGWAVAAWLRWRGHPLFLSEVMFQLFENANISPFQHIIRLVEANNLMKPRLSH
jgi:hypothetical protein